MKGIVVFKGKYGATEQYAKWVGNTLRIPVYDEQDVNSVKLASFDYVIAGSSVYVGKLQLKKWITAHQSILASKKLFLFIVCATPPRQQGEMEKMLSNNINKPLLNAAKVFFLRGRMIKSRLSLWDRVVLTLGAAVQKNKADKKRMLTNFDDVKREHLDPLIQAVKRFTEYSNV